MDSPVPDRRPRPDLRLLPGDPCPMCAGRLTVRQPAVLACRICRLTIWVG